MPSDTQQWQHQFWGFNDEKKPKETIRSFVIKMPAGPKQDLYTVKGSDTKWLISRFLDNKNTIKQVKRSYIYNLFFQPHKIRPASRMDTYATKHEEQIGRNKMLH